MNGNFADPHQLIFEIAPEPAFTEEDFLIFDGNRKAHNYLASWPRWPALVTLLCGPPKSGKTHLAAIWCERAGAVRLSNRDLAKVSDLAALVAKQPVCVEDIDTVEASETVLFHFLNAARTAHQHVLLTAEHSVQEWSPDLPDLASRLRAATPAMIDELHEHEVTRFLVKLIAHRELTIDSKVLDYIGVRAERSYEAVVALADALDRLSLAAKRPISRAIAAKALDQLAS